MFIIIFADECGIQEDINRESGRIQDDPITGKAQKLYDTRTGTTHNKLGLISGYSRLPDQTNYQYIAPWVYDGTCDTSVFNTWLKEVFIPEVKLLRIAYPKNPVALVIDNVAYHKSQRTLDLCNQNGIYLVFQSPYSPDLNPIEPSWNTTKNDIRSQSYLPITFQDKLFNSLNQRSWNCN
jgi:transposase